MAKKHLTEVGHSGKKALADAHSAALSAGSATAHPAQISGELFNKGKIFKNSLTKSILNHLTNP